MSYEYVTGENLVTIMHRDKNRTETPEFIDLAEKTLNAIKSKPEVLAHFMTAVTLQADFDIIDHAICFMHIGIMLGVKLTELRECPECGGSKGSHREIFVKTGQNGLGDVEGFYRQCKTGEKE